jgi:hypothetical protein
LGGGAEAVKVLFELEDSAVVEAKALPDGIATLYRGVEGANAGFVAMDQLPVDVDQEVAVFFVEFLEHGE